MELVGALNAEEGVGLVGGMIFIVGGLVGEKVEGRGDRLQVLGEV